MRWLLFGVVCGVCVDRKGVARGVVMLDSAYLAEPGSRDGG